MRAIWTAVVPTFLAVPASAQVGALWAADFDSSARHDVSRAVATDGARIAVAGWSSGPVAGFPPGSSFSDIETVVYDASGALAWSRRFDSGVPSDDYGNEIALVPGGGVAVVGNSVAITGPNAGSRRTALLYSAAGTLVYSRVVGNTSTASSGRALAIAANGDVILGGVDGAQGGNLCVERLDGLGGVVWSTLLDGGALGRDVVDDVVVGPGGDVWAAGYVATSASGRDLVVLRLSGSTGVVQWTATFDGGANADDYAVDLAVDASGRAFAAGLARVPGRAEDAVVVAVSPTGSILWNRTLDGGALSTDWAFGVALDPFGRIVAGGSISTTTTGIDLAAWRLDVGGALLWSGSWDGPLGGNDEMSSFGVDALGNLVIAGTSPGAAGGFDLDFLLVSWDAQGALAWTHGDDGTGSGTQIAAAVAVTTELVALTGPSTVVPGGADPDYRTVVLARTALPFCLGDGSAAPCPCANTSASAEQAGCANSFGSGGRVRAQGASSLASDTLVLVGSSMPNSSCLYFQGTTAQAGGSGAPFGDGLRCAGGAVIRLGTKSNVDGASQYPGVGDPSVSVRGVVGAPGTRTYQVWYRNSAAFCTNSTFNLTNGLAVTWTL